MKTPLDGTVNVLVPTGALGIGVREADFTPANMAGAHAIACDAGSTDSGPAYLATGRAKYSRDAVKHDLRILMRAQSAERIPLLIGSCGTSGSDAALDWTRDIALEIAREEGLAPRIALLYSEQPPSLMAERARAGRIEPLAPLTSVDPAPLRRVRPHRRPDGARALHRRARGAAPTSCSAAAPPTLRCSPPCR